MDYAKLERFTSKPRLDRFLVSCANSQERALRLYDANLRVSQAFYSIMNLLETFLRNSLNDNLAIHFGDAAWIINQKNGFMNDPSLGPKFWIKAKYAFSSVLRVDKPVIKLGVKPGRL